jgi:hypothetical protein
MALAKIEARAAFCFSSESVSGVFGTAVICRPRSDDFEQLPLNRGARPLWPANAVRGFSGAWLSQPYI